jgi:hypothetical protein
VSLGDWIVVVVGAALVAFELWFFLGGGPGGRRGGPDATRASNA